MVFHNKLGNIFRFNFLSEQSERVIQPGLSRFPLHRSISRTGFCIHPVPDKGICTRSGLRPGSRTRECAPFSSVLFKLCLSFVKTCFYKL